MTLVLAVVLAQFGTEILAQPFIEYMHELELMPESASIAVKFSANTLLDRFEPSGRDTLSIGAVVSAVKLVFWIV